MERHVHFLLLTLMPAGVMLWLAQAIVIGDSGVWRHRGMRTDLDRAHRKLAAVETVNAQLEREVGQLRADEVTVRRAVAEELVLVPAGSVVYRFTE